MAAITGMHIAYYVVCPRKLWLWAHGIQLENIRVPGNRGTDLVAEGRRVEEFSYERRAEIQQGIQIETEDFHIKIDYYDQHTHTLHETKKSTALEEAHQWQTRFYLYVLNQIGLPAHTAIIEYPLLRQRTTLHYSPHLATEVEELVKNIRQCIAAPQCPPLLHAPRCKSCAYYEFCYTGETDGQDDIPD